MDVAYYARARKLRSSSPAVKALFRNRSAEPCGGRCHWASRSGCRCMGRVEPRTARGTSRRRLMPREQEGREAAWESETDPQTRQIASRGQTGRKTSSSWECRAIVVEEITSICANFVVERRR